MSGAPRGDPPPPAGLADGVAVELAGQAIQGASALIARGAHRPVHHLRRHSRRAVERRWPSTALPPRRGTAGVSSGPRPLMLRP